MKKIFYVSFIMMIVLASIVSAEKFGTGAAAKVPRKILEACYTADYAREQLMKDFESKKIQLKTGEDYVGIQYLIAKKSDSLETMTIINGDLYYFFDTATTEIMEGFNITLENLKISNTDYEILYARGIVRINGVIVSVFYPESGTENCYYEDLN